MKHILLLIAVAFTLQAHSQQGTSMDTVYNSDSSHYTLLHYATEPITINIPALKIGNSVVMQKARVHAMIFNQKSKTVSVSTEILAYAFEGSTFTDTSYKSNANYGERITDIPMRGVEILATNTTFVNPSTGAIIRNPTSGMVVGQYDFFYFISTYQPVKVNELIAQYLQQNTDWSK